MSQSQSTAIQKHTTNTELLKKLLFKGDLSSLTPEQQIQYYIQRCERIGLDPYSKPFDFLEIKDKKTGEMKIVLYANKEASAQLIKREQMSIERLERSEENGVYTVVAHVRTPDGRAGINLSVAKVKGLEGANYENAVKRCVTQAIRRAILMTCGLGDTDESEVSDIPNARALPFPDQEIVMTEQEANQLILGHKSSSLDQWRCGRALAMKLITICKLLEAQGADETIWHSWLPSGITTRKDLSEDRAQQTFDNFQKRLESIKNAELDKWQCSSGLAIRLMDVCGHLAAKGVDTTTMKERLGGVRSLKDLSEEKATEALRTFTHWLKSYNEVTKEEGATNG